jgi:hypothetical protein
VTGHSRTETLVVRVGWFVDHRRPQIDRDLRQVELVLIERVYPLGVGQVVDGRLNVMGAGTD